MKTTSQPARIKHNNNNNNTINCDDNQEDEEDSLRKEVEVEECRSCGKIIRNGERIHQLKEIISDKTKIHREIDEQMNYGELLQQLLNSQMPINDWIEALMPQIICEKCSTLLRSVQQFIKEAERMHQIYLQRTAIIKMEDCLAEAPIDLPSTTTIEDSTIKTEPPQLPEITALRLQIIERQDDPGGLRHLNEDDDVTVRNDDVDLQTLLIKDRRDDRDDLFSLETEEGEEDPPIKEDQKWWAVRCDICQNIYRNAAALTIHKKYTHAPEEEKIPCALCNYRTCRISNLKTHLRTMHGPESVAKYIQPRRLKRVANFNCQHCSRCYCRKDDLQRHIKKKHELCDARTASTIETTKRKATTDRFLCTFCGQTFESKKGLCQHSRRHTGERPYKCDVCGKAFMRQQDMKLHRLIHSDEKPHQCTVCGKTFKRKDKLTTHKRVHSELRPYKCTECDKTFKYSTVLRTHMHIHTGEKPFQCQSCGECFSLRSSLNIHCRKSNHLK